MLSGMNVIENLHVQILQRSMFTGALVIETVNIWDAGIIALHDNKKTTGYKEQELALYVTG